MPDDPIPDWLRSVRGEIADWLKCVSIPGHPGWIRYCSEGDRLAPGPRAGLAFSCLGLKLVHMLGLFETYPREVQQGWVEHIQDFQRRFGRMRGYFEDPALLRTLDRFLKPAVGARLGETRQALVALMSVGSHPRHRLPIQPKTPDAAALYIRSLNWGRDPWGAGSHASLLMVFLEAQARLFGQRDPRERLLPAVLAEVEGLRHAENGCWYRGTPAPANMLNGAMKVLSGYEFLQRPLDRLEPLVDFALAQRNDADACHHVDIVYVLQQCTSRTPYRRDEIRQWARERIEGLWVHRRSDGGFSFNPEGTGTTYYGVTVGSGAPVSDIHGTKLFVWALVLLADILGWREALKWNLAYT